ncbi:MAG: hypothetical protein NTZ09_18485 [Candidatus Hydrogenedentes bacterium]|nr:hypothetical protein [Candidatus Hydrogenedentota bacterium]
MSEDGYVNYFEILALDESAKPGDVRKNYKKMMKDLIMEIARVEITGERRDRFLLEMAKLNAAFYVLRDNEVRETYWRQRAEVIQLESQWREAAQNGDAATDALRRSFDSKLRHFLSRYVEEAMLEAGRDKEAVEASNWDAAHERHASRILRHYRHNLYQQILDRLPYWEITTPRIDWVEREKAVAAMLAGER